MSILIWGIGQSVWLANATGAIKGQTFCGESPEAMDWDLSKVAKLGGVLRLCGHDGFFIDVTGLPAQTFCSD